MKKLLLAGGILTTLFVASCVFLSVTQNEYPETISQPTSSTFSAPAEPTEAGVYLELNEIRKENDLPRYDRNPALDKAADYRCNDMVRYSYFGHDNPKTKKRGAEVIYDILYAETDYPRTIITSENLIIGYADTSEAFARDWLNSEAHKAALLDPQFTDAGVAVCEDDKQFIVVHTMANFK